MDQMPDEILDNTSTPAASNAAKRTSSILSSPEDLAESKRNRVCSSIDMSEESTPDLESTQYNHISLSKDDLTFISSKLVESFNEQMRDTVKEVISSMIPELVKSLDKSLADKMNALELENDELKKRVVNLEIEVDRANQYSRRNSIRISGIPEESGEKTDTLVMTMATAIGANLTIEEIDRSHRVGKPRPQNRADVSSKPRDILVKFGTYRSRQKIYTKRSQLKSKGYAKCFVNEDLTRNRSALLYQARKMKRDGIILDAWTSDGPILIKEKSGRICAINVIDDLDTYKRKD